MSADHGEEPEPTDDALRLLTVDKRFYRIGKHLLHTYISLYIPNEANCTAKRRQRLAALPTIYRRLDIRQLEQDVDSRDTPAAREVAEALMGMRSLRWLRIGVRHGPAFLDERIWEAMKQLPATMTIQHLSMPAYLGLATNRGYDQVLNRFANLRSLDLILGAGMPMLLDLPNVMTLRVSLITSDPAFEILAIFGRPWPSLRRLAIISHRQSALAPLDWADALSRHAPQLLELPLVLSEVRAHLELTSLWSHLKQIKMCARLLLIAPILLDMLDVLSFSLEVGHEVEVDGASAVRDWLQASLTGIERTSSHLRRLEVFPFDFASTILPPPDMLHLCGGRAIGIPQFRVRSVARRASRWHAQLHSQALHGLFSGGGWQDSWRSDEEFARLTA